MHRNLVYTNNELSDNHLSFHTERSANQISIEIRADRLAIAHYIVIDDHGGLYVNDQRYCSLFEAFKGVLEVIMDQVRLLFL